MSSSRVILLGFLLVIALGTMLLMLPIATQDRDGASLTDALFTATSSVCVTGLVVQNTATYWSYFGQAVIISLIQIGGMGDVTLAGGYIGAEGVGNSKAYELYPKGCFHYRICGSARNVSGIRS